jgi:hypothetical protein
MDSPVEHDRVSEISDLVEEKIIELLQEAPSASVIQAARQYLRDAVTSRDAMRPESKLEIVKEEVESRMPFPIAKTGD